MGTRRSVVRLLAGIAITDLTYRVSQVVLPLVVMTTTGSVTSAGLVAGAVGVPTLLSPWWARRLRDRIRTGRAVALCYLGEAVCLSAIPVAAVLGHLDTAVLLAAGLGVGTFEALDGPGRDALLADLGDRIGPDSGFLMLNLRELCRRIAMVAGPAVGGIAVAAGGGVQLLWIEAAADVTAAALAFGIAVVPGPVTEEAARILPSLLERPQVLAGWIIRGTGNLCWFSFTLGLTVLGLDHGHAATFSAVGLASYGLASGIATPLSVPLLRRLPVLPTIAVAWLVAGLCWIAMGLIPTIPAVAGLSAFSGACVIVGNNGVTALITRTSQGSQRRALIAGQSVLTGAAGSAGSLVGGTVLAILGATPTLVLTGTITGFVSLGVATAMARQRTALLVGQNSADR